MRALIVLLLMVVQVVSPVAGSAALQTDADDVARVAVELSALEAAGDFNTLYDRIHPDSRAEVPRLAAVGWFENEFAPRGPGVSTVTGVQFVSWTWAVTGVTYPYTAEVFFVQPFADGTVVEDVVRLVQDHKGEWRWFFGRSREFVDEQIARYVPVAPVVPLGESKIEWVIADIDSYWAGSFASAGVTYTSPSIMWIEGYTPSGCGVLDPVKDWALYCSPDQTIYLEPYWFFGLEYTFGDFAWITVLAHEWGHYVQHMTGHFGGPPIGVELQADCLAGSYALNAATLGYLEQGDLVEGLAVAASAGDPVWLPSDHPDAHGSGDDRVTAFMFGYLDGFVGCGFSPATTSAVAPPPAPPTPAEPLWDVLPRASAIPHDLTLVAEYERPLSDVVVNYTDPVLTDALFREWGWQGNIVQRYEGTGWSTGVTSVYISIHQFDGRRGASGALAHSVEDQMASTGAWAVPVAALGQETIGLVTAGDATVYARSGNVVIRLTVTTTGGDALAEAEAIVAEMVD